jgi:hypothetical protein
MLISVFFCSPTSSAQIIFPRLTFDNLKKVHPLLPIKVIGLAGSKICIRRDYSRFHNIKFILEVQLIWIIEGINQFDIHNSVHIQYISKVQPTRCYVSQIIHFTKMFYMLAASFDKHQKLYVRGAFKF